MLNLYVPFTQQPISEILKKLPVFENNRAYYAHYDNSKWLYLFMDFIGKNSEEKEYYIRHQEPTLKIYLIYEQVKYSACRPFSFSISYGR